MMASIQAKTREIAESMLKAESIEGKLVYEEDTGSRFRWYHFAVTAAPESTVVEYLSGGCYLEKGNMTLINLQPKDAMRWTQQHCPSHRVTEH